jgi:hypothetical protein
MAGGAGGGVVRQAGRQTLILVVGPLSEIVSIEMSCSGS